MDQSNATLNQLIADWPRGCLATVDSLKEKGYYLQLLDKYKTGKWVESVGQGVYKLKNDPVDWQGGVHTLQAQLRMDVHPGGLTALELQGYAHYLSETLRQCLLFVSTGQRLPKWFREYPWNIKVTPIATSLFTSKQKAGMTTHRHKNFTIQISAPERAVLEMLSLVPDKQGFDEAAHTLENLTTLRPEVVQMLLEDCRSIKSKRLFLFLAERAGHAWVEDLKLDDVDLGKGKRQVVTGGVLDKKYEITVPREFAR